VDPRFKYRRHKTSDQQGKKDAESERDRVQLNRGMGFALVIPTYLVMGPVSGWLLGSWLDQRMGTAFWLPTLIVLCTVASFSMVIRLLAKINS
jgi:F0F1-type ATP synthase assembly protein I